MCITGYCVKFSFNLWYAQESHTRTSIILYDKCNPTLKTPNEYKTSSHAHTKYNIIIILLFNSVYKRLHKLDTTLLCMYYFTVLEGARASTGLCVDLSIGVII